MNLEITILMPRRCGFLHADGQGRVIGLFAQIPFEPLWVAIIHLDHPEIVVRFDDLPTFTLKVDRPVSNLTSSRSRRQYKAGF